jgi:DNA repair photolyase
MVNEISVKTILNPVRQPDTWFGLKYNMNLYRGCQHQCIYCDSRSECYRIEDFSRIEVKINALELLEDLLPRKRVVGTIGFGSMNDPYMPVERQYRMTGRALEIIQRHDFPIHILTKSDLVLQDQAVIKDISRIYAAVSFTITTADDDLAAILEPGAPPPSGRFRALEEFASAGILTGVVLMPVLPFLEDGVENIQQIVRQAGDSGASYIIPAFGISLRPGSRDYYYHKLDQHFPGLKERYIRAFGDSYQCPCPNWRDLERAFRQEIQHYHINSRMPVFAPQKRVKEQGQLPLFRDNSVE